MKALRRSFKGDRDTKPHHISITPKSAIAIQPPKKVIKALYDYDPDASHPHELGFHRGDFFHVISRENDQDWYEACNPLIPSARGLVPVSYFEVIGKNERQSTGSAASAASTPQLPDSGNSAVQHRRTGSNARAMTNGHASMATMSKTPMVYGVVKYDFEDKRADELSVFAGEKIIIIAQSTKEWFVVKPIERLGGPGLVPVDFIEVRDGLTDRTVADPLEAVQAAGVPKVEEWKRMAANYKNNSITLGRLDTPNTNSAASLQQSMGRMSLNNGEQQHLNGHAPSQPGPEQRASSQPQLLAPISASIPRYCFENDKYWYIIECVLEDGSHWELSRFYQNFYDFQIALLQQFPVEAATQGGTRVLPFMPGPVTYVTDAISNGRRESLDEYVKRLLALPPYISRCQLVRQLFAPREGDFELDPKAMQEDYRLSRASQQSSSVANSHSPSRQSSQNQLNGNYTLSQQRNNPRNQTPLQPGPTQQNPYGSPPNPAMHPMNRQPSSLTQASVDSKNGQSGTPNPPPLTSTATSGALKIKVFFEDDCIAIRVPAEISFSQLRDKLSERLKVREEIMIQYKDEPTGGYAELLSDQDLDFALQRNARLQLYVGYA